MKNLKYLFLASFLLVFFSSCDDLLDDDPTTPFEKVLGTYSVEETSPTFGTQHYYVSISKDPYVANVLSIYNFFDMGSFIRVVGEVVDGNIELAPQDVDGFKIFGEGEISDDFDRIDFIYTIEELATAKGIHGETVEAVYTRID